MLKNLVKVKAFANFFYLPLLILHTSRECAARQSTLISGTISSGHYPHHMCMCLNNVSKHLPNTKYTMCICLRIVVDFLRMDTSHPSLPSLALFAEYSPPSVIIGRRLWKLQLVIFQNINFFKNWQKIEQFQFFPEHFPNRRGATTEIKEAAASFLMNSKFSTISREFPMIGVYNIKHNLARSCFQFWLSKSAPRVTKFWEKNCIS